MGGRIERRIELGEEGEAKDSDGDTGTNDEHKGLNVTKGNQLFIQNILHFLYNLFSFIEKRKIGKLRRRDASGDRSSGGSYTSSSRTVVCFLFLPILQEG